MLIMMINKPAKHCIPIQFRYLENMIEKNIWFIQVTVSESLDCFPWNGITIIHLQNDRNLSTNSACVNYGLSVCKFSSSIIRKHNFLNVLPRRLRDRILQNAPQTELWNKTSEKLISGDIFSLTNRKKVFFMLELWWIPDHNISFRRGEC